VDRPSVVDLAHPPPDALRPEFLKATFAGMQRALRRTPSIAALALSYRTMKQKNTRAPPGSSRIVTGSVDQEDTCTLCRQHRSTST
jgi:hypothetical protein